MVDCFNIMKGQTTFLIQVLIRFVIKSSSRYFVTSRRTNHLKNLLFFSNNNIDKTELIKPWWQHSSFKDLVYFCHFKQTCRIKAGKNNLFKAFFISTPGVKVEIQKKNGLLHFEKEHLVEFSWQFYKYVLSPIQFNPE